MITTSLFEAYMATCYEIINPKIEIFINDENEKLQLFLKEHHIKSWCFITAWNPYSTVLTEEENIALNLLLKEDLNQHPVYLGQGKDAQGIWPSEASFFVGNITLNKAKELGIKYRQNAIVFGEINQKAQLITLVAVEF